MKVKTTAAVAPWSNGICECHNVRNDTNFDWETALAWEISAKNIL